MPDQDSEPKSRQERKSKGKFNKKHTDDKYTTKHARAYENNLLRKGWTKT
jgi:hypothetical protein